MKYLCHIEDHEFYLEFVLNGAFYNYVHKNVTVTEPKRPGRVWTGLCRDEVNPSRTQNLKKKQTTRSFET